MEINTPCDSCSSVGVAVAVAKTGDVAHPYVLIVHRSGRCVFLRTGWRSEEAFIIDLWLQGITPGQVDVRLLGLWEAIVHGRTRT